MNYLNLSGLIIILKNTKSESLTQFGCVDKQINILYGNVCSLIIQISTKKSIYITSL